MKLKSTLVHLLTGLALATPGWGDVIGVDATGTATSAGHLDPASRTWKRLGTSFPLAGMTVNTSISGGYDGYIGTHSLAIFDKYRHNGGSGTLTVTITGLNDAHSYKLAVIMAQDFVGGRGGTATVTTTGATNPAAKSSSVGSNFTTFVDEDNCVLFEGLRTGTTPGQITFTVTNGPDGIGIFNGFEIENVDPNPPGIRGPAPISATSNGNPISLTVPVRNTAAVDYHVTGTSYSGANAAEFSDATEKPLTIPAGSTVDLLVDFTPSAGGQRQASLVLATDDPNASSVPVPLTVQVNDPEIVIPDKLAFGTFTAVPGPVTAMLDVENRGRTLPLTVSSPVITGPGATAFSVTSLPGSIATDSVEELELTFNPPAPGVYAAQLTLATNDPNKPTVSVNLSGQVIGGGVSKMSWGFDHTSGTVASNGGTVADDSGSANAGLLLGPGRGDGGTYSADIPVAGAAIGQARDVTGTGSLTLSGTGGLSTGSGAFTGQALNGLSAAAIEAAGGLTYQVWVKNITGTEQYGSVMSLGGMHVIRYNPTTGLSFSFGDGSITPMSYGLMETPEWTHLAAVMVVTPGTGAKAYSRIMTYVNGVKVGEHAAHTFPWFLERGASVGMHPVLASDYVSGQVYEPRLSVGTLTPQEFTVVAPPAGIFAPASVKGTNQGDPDELTIAVENTSSTGRTLTAPTLSGPHAAFFSVSQYPSSLGAASSGQIVVDFDSVASGGGTFTATLTIHSNDPARPSYQVPLAVEVHDPSVTAPTSLHFGQLTGPGAATSFVNIDNSGINVNLVLSNPQLTGDGAAAYSVSFMPEPIAPGARGQVGVTFALGAVGIFPAQLTFDTNDPFKPTITFALTGEVTSVIEPSIKVTSVKMVSASRLRIDFEGAENTTYLVKSSDDLVSPFSGSVTPAVDGLTTNSTVGGRGVGHVEIDVAVPGRKFFQIQSP